MSDLVIDLKKQLRELKAGERMAACDSPCPWARTGRPGRSAQDRGLHQAEWFGYLTLTFQIDLGRISRNTGPWPKPSAGSRHSPPGPTRPWPGPPGQGVRLHVVHGPGLAEGEVWFMAEADIY
jgi:hypothetical protein